MKRQESNWLIKASKSSIYISIVDGRLFRLAPIDWLTDWLTDWLIDCAALIIFDASYLPWLTLFLFAWTKRWRPHRRRSTRRRRRLSRTRTRRSLSSWRPRWPPSCPKTPTASAGCLSNFSMTGASPKSDGMKAARQQGQKNRHQKKWEGIYEIIQAYRTSPGLSRANGAC